MQPVVDNFYRLSVIADAILALRGAQPGDYLPHTCETCWYVCCESGNFSCPSWTPCNPDVVDLT